MTLRPSMRATTSAIIAAGFILSHVAGYLIYSYDREGALEIAGAGDITERAADASRLLRDLPETWRSDVVHLLNSRTFRIWASDEAEFQMGDPSEDELELLNYLRQQVPRIADQEMRVRFVERAELPRELGPRVGSPLSADAPALGISIRHGEDDWLNVLGVISTPPSLLPGLLFANIASATLAIGLVAFWLVSRVTAPLARLSEAADALGRNLSAPPLEVTGPREVAIAAAAFNRMQSRLLQLIKGRTELLAGISHDLRTPLTQIRLRTEMTPASPHRDKNLKSIDEMEAIVGTFLAYARATNDVEETTRSDVGALVDSVCDDLADCGAAVECESEPGIVLSCKRTAIRRAVANVIENGLKYGERVIVRTMRRDAFVMIAVEDDGPGIPPSQLDAVFAPFYRGEKARSSAAGGVGLGLSIAQAIIEDHGGEIRLRNRPEGGLRAEVLLPA